MLSLPARLRARNEGPLLPKGAQLASEEFQTRLRVVLVGLFLALVAVGTVGILSDEGVVHTLTELAPVAGCLIVGKLSRDRGIATGAVTVGLALAGAMLVHFTDGLIESHFAFFVSLPLIALLHDWRAVLGATLIVFLHHAMFALFVPDAVYNHPAAQENPVLWGSIHVAFVLALVAVLFVHWRYSESEKKATQRALAEATRSQAQLVQAGDRFRSLVQNAFDAIVLVGQNDRIDYVGGAFGTVFGRDHDDHVGRPLSVLVGHAVGDSATELVELVDEVRRSGRVQFGEVRFLRADGSMRWIEIVGRQLGDAPTMRPSVVLNARDVTESREASDVLRHNATHDELTGLPNRSVLIEKIDEALLHGGDASVGLLFLDVDRFKNINDSMGHLSGDRLLMSIAETLIIAVEPGQTVARLGGDEFAILVEGWPSFESLIEQGERFRCEFDEPIDLEGMAVNVSVSVGVALAGPGEDAHVLLRNADVAMYQAKQAGRSRIAVFDEDARAEKERRLVIEAELRAADFDHEMLLQYQPIIDVPSGLTAGVEALVRWQHPERGFLPPGAFIEAAEESGIILALGDWVLREGCRQGAAWQRELGVDLYVSINVSARQLGQPGFGGVVAQVLEETGFSPELLVVEVTESALVDDPVMASNNLTEIRGLGVRAALDDYGTGYAALTYLRTLPLTHIKIDRSFIDGIEASAQAATIVENTVSLARGLGLLTVAEGIETEEQYQILSGFGCDYAQGYHLGRPMDAIDVEAAVLRRAAPAPAEVGPVAPPDARAESGDDSVLEQPTSN